MENGRRVVQGDGGWGGLEGLQVVDGFAAQIVEQGGGGEGTAVHVQCQVGQLIRRVAQSPQLLAGEVGAEGLVAGGGQRFGRLHRHPNVRVFVEREQQAQGLAFVGGDVDG